MAGSRKSILRKQEVLSSGASKAMEGFCAPTGNVIYWKMWPSARTAVRWENPRTDYEAPKQDDPRG
jgi:hypothetical protein